MPTDPHNSFNGPSWWYAAYVFPPGAQPESLLTATSRANRRLSARSEAKPGSLCRGRRGW